MFIKLNLPFINIDKKDLINFIKIKALEYYQKVRNSNLSKVEDFVNDLFKTNYNIDEMVISIFENLLITQVNNDYFITILKDSKYNQVKLVSLEHLITFGNRNIKGNSIIRDSIDFALSLV